MGWGRISIVYSRHVKQYFHCLGKLTSSWSLAMTEHTSECLYRVTCAGSLLRCLLQDSPTGEHWPKAHGQALYLLEGSPPGIFLFDDFVLFLVVESYSVSEISFKFGQLYKYPNPRFGKVLCSI